MGTSHSRSHSGRRTLQPLNPLTTYQTQHTPVQQTQQPPAPPSFFKSPTLKFRAIADRYQTLPEVQDALRKEGLESSNLIVAIDFTKSNEWTGKKSFNGLSLHAVGDSPNPYESAIGAIGRTLSAFDDDGLIPCYGFGDSTTSDRSVFSFMPGDAPCQGLEQVLWRYRELCPYVRMAGPTSFAPAIRQACRLVESSGNQYHILLLVADGQVTRPSSLEPGEQSEQEKDTIDAIVEASHLPLSIIMVGVGDGPWDLMKDFDDALPQRQFDNFQFVNFTDVMSKTTGDQARRETLFAVRALMEIPEQYKAIQSLGLLNRGSLRRPNPRRANPPLDPPVPPALAAPPGSTALPGASLPGRHSEPGPRYGAPGASSGGGKAGHVQGQAQYAPALAQTSSAGGAGGRFSHPGAAPVPAVGGAGPSGPAGGGPAPEAMFLCPITQDVMSDPVIAADGYTYERAAIADWLARRATSPMTNAPMPGGAAGVLIPNHGLRSAIMEWRQRHGLLQQAA